jgi:hypothetical protein
LPDELVVDPELVLLELLLHAAAASAAASKITADRNPKKARLAVTVLT